MNSSKATCTVTARCATLTHTSGRTSTTLTTITSTHTAILLALALAGAIGFAGNWLAALVRSRAGRRLESPALIADGDHARIDAYVSLAVIASAIAIAAGAPILDPIIGLGMTVVILRITRESWRTVRGHPHHH